MKLFAIMWEKLQVDVNQFSNLLVEFIAGKRFLAHAEYKPDGRHHTLDGPLSLKDQSCKVFPYTTFAWCYSLFQ